MKISIIGTGNVGSTTAFALLHGGLGTELVLVDRNLEHATGDALDLNHAAAFVDSRGTASAGTIADTAGSEIIVFTASAPKTPEIKSRNDLGRANQAIVQDLVPKIAKKSPNAILIMVSNPVDVMTQLALQVSSYPPRRVMGTGTLIDSARFRALLSEREGIHPADIRAYVLGEHGDAQFPVMSTASRGGELVPADAPTQQLFQQTVEVGHEVMRRKGHTNFAIALAVKMLVSCIARDTRQTVPVSVLVDGYYGINGVCLSVPVVLGRHGVERQLHPPLNADEHAALVRAADSVRKSFADVTADR